MARYSFIKIYYYKNLNFIAININFGDLPAPSGENNVEIQLPSGSQALIFVLAGNNVFPHKK
jgi:hypothetical protein